MDKQPGHQHDPSDAEFEKHVEAVLAAERRNRIQWAATGIGVALLGIGLFVLFAEYRTFFFRPKPDMKVIEQVAFDKTNDPACRTLLTNVDAQKDRLEEVRLEMRDLHASTDPAALEKGRTTLAEMIADYKVEQRRREIIITKEDRSQTELAQYFTHVLFYLEKLDGLLAAREAGLGDSDAGTDAGAVAPAQAADAGTPETPEEAYDRAWRMITEDHDKWRVYRQGPVPCGSRTGEVPALPSGLQQLHDGADAGTAQEGAAPTAPSNAQPPADAPADDAPAPDDKAPAADAPAEAPASDAPTEAPPTEVQPATDAPAGDAPAGNAPAGDAPAEAPAGNAPAGDVAPDRDRPAGDAPAPPATPAEATP